LRLVAKKPGTQTSFIDSVLEEVILQFSWKMDGSVNVAFHVYDSLGQLVADSDGEAPVAPLVIVAQDGEVLLEIPEEIGLHISYRLRNQSGRLLTASDGKRTQIYPFLKMETRIPKAEAAHGSAGRMRAAS
jgi:hypothetical protein